jgi:predicted nucleotidyltransferase
MAKKARPLAKTSRQRWYRGANVPMAVFRRFARQVAQRFNPDKIILFGSYAYGTPHADSDVDVLVIMPTRNQLDQAFKIHWAIQPPFSLDIIVRTPKNMKWRLDEGESFLTEVVSRGKVLYEASHGSRCGRPKPTGSAPDTAAAAKFPSMTSCVTSASSAPKST